MSSPNHDRSRPPRVVAVMQPYFYPYAGYFRLLAAADVFVILDDVQFPRRGRVHRCEIPRSDGGKCWLTLPLAAQRRDTQIKDLNFPDDARAVLDARLRGVPWLRQGRGPLAAAVREQLHEPLSTPLDFVEAGLALVAGALTLPATRVRSSSLDVDRTLRGQHYIIALARAADADMYINAPGGRHLYDDASFSAAGLGLRFLEPYAGRFPHLLSALMTESPSALRQDVLEGCTLLA